MENPKHPPKEYHLSLIKHLFLDELDKATNSALNLSKEMASHTTNVTETVYLIGRNKRKKYIFFLKHSING